MFFRHTIWVDMSLRRLSTSLLFVTMACGLRCVAQATDVPAEAATPAPAKLAVVVKPDYSAPLAEAKGMVGSGDYVGADRALRELIGVAPELAEAHFLLGFALLHEGRPADSLTEYTAGAKFREPGAEELVGVALDYIQLKDLPDADKWLTASVKKAPERALAWYLLGRTQYEEGRGGEAERSLLTCLRLDPKNLQAEYNLGRAYVLLKRTAEAETAFRAAISWQDGAVVKDTVPYLELGMLLKRANKTAEAIPFLSMAAGDGSRDALADRELGLAFEQMRRYNEAAGALHAAIALSPKDEGLQFFLGRVYREAGRPGEAAKAFAEAARLDGAAGSSGQAKVGRSE
jgi:tetratricopeptide (TPR) repeat protein